MLVWREPVSRQLPRLLSRDAFFALERRDRASVSVAGIVVRAVQQPLLDDVRRAVREQRVALHLAEPNAAVHLAPVNRLPREWLGRALGCARGAGAVDSGATGVEAACAALDLAAPAPPTAGESPPALVSASGFEGSNPEFEEIGCVAVARGLGKAESTATLSHELMHGLFYSCRALRRRCQCFWEEEADAGERAAWISFLEEAGYDPEAPDLAAHVQDNCPALRMAGLMTIGAPGDASCFDSLRSCRDVVAARLDVPPESLELSMGMSGDFEAATLAGSTSVRVGSSIFGARAYPPKA